MIRILCTGLMLFLIAAIFSGCHAKQEKAWEDAIAAAELRIAEDEFLSKWVDSIELERRQWIRLYMRNPGYRAGFAKITEGVCNIIGEELFKQEGNTFKELIVKANLKDGDEILDEIVVARYTPETGAQITKDRTMHSM